MECSTPSTFTRPYIPSHTYHLNQEFYNKTPEIETDKKVRLELYKWIDKMINGELE